MSYVNLAHLTYDRAVAEGKECDDKVDELLDKAMECLDDVALTRDGNYAFICSKCASAYEFFGRFLDKEELVRRAEEIYKNNGKQV